MTKKERDEENIFIEETEKLGSTIAKRLCDIIRKLQAENEGLMEQIMHWVENND